MNDTPPKSALPFRKLAGTPHPGDASPGTLLWIGNRRHHAFPMAYQVAESYAAQVAFRETLESAIKRPALGVDTIVVASEDRRTLSGRHLLELEDRHPGAARFRLLGPLCAGHTRLYASFFSKGRIAEARGVEVLQQHYQSLTECPSTRTLADQPAAIAIVAAHYNNAEPLLEIAQAAGAPAVWCRQPNQTSVRGLKMVWWDDSFASPTDCSQWQDRLSLMGAKSNQHVWITQLAHHDQINEAKRAGISTIAMKPYPIDVLHQTLISSASQGTSPISVQAA